ncbi:MAG: hypothetical protein IJP15_06395 [Oscillospiraceae bacterium]|nr:hypothetical protein [Oscillospiraceae bacterium]
MRKLSICHSEGPTNLRRRQRRDRSLKSDGGDDRAAGQGADPDIERQRSQIRLQGEVPSPMNPPAGCHFCNRCAFAGEICGKVAPQLREIEPGHFVACHLFDKK